MDAREHLYKVLVIGEYGVGKRFQVLLACNFDTAMRIDCLFLFFFPREGKHCNHRMDIRFSVTSVLLQLARSV